MLNPFFLQGSQTEQNLVQDLINEQLRMYGVEVYYLPRKYITEKTIIKEVVESLFDVALPIEAYVENYEGYGDNQVILSKFGIQSTHELTLTISKDRYANYISPLTKNLQNIKLSSRPKEGDLIYFPLGERLFEIKFVEHEQPFYQLLNNYVYKLKCELFRYEDEIIDTSIEEIDEEVSGIDDNIDGTNVRTQTLTMVGVGTTATAITSIVNGGIRYITLTNRGGGYSYAPRVAISSAPTGGITGIASAIMIGGIVVCDSNVNPSNKSVQSVELINPGYGYTVAPKIKFIGDGSGANAVSVIGDGVVGIVTVTNTGGGYVTPPQITFTGISTVSAAATAVLDFYGRITSIRITNAGLGYTVSPTIQIGDPFLSGIGTYIINEVVTGSVSGSTARVRNWSAVTRKLEISSADGVFVSGENVVGSASSAIYKISTLNQLNDQGFTSNNQIEIEADQIIDFSEINPFGMP